METKRPSSRQLPRPRSYNPLPTRLLPCPYCGEVYTAGDAFSKHLDTEHPGWLTRSIADLGLHIATERRKCD